MGFEYLKVFTGRRFPFDYISPAVCEGEFSSSGTPFISLLPILRRHGPTGPVMSADGNRFHFSWNTVLGALCYSVYKAVDEMDPFGPYTLVAECITDTFYDTEDPGLYKVEALTPDGVTDFSDPVHTPAIGGGGGGLLPQAYWSFEGDWVDEINGLPMPPDSGAVDFTTGWVGAQGARFMFGGSIQQHFTDTGVVSDLAYAGNGISICGWFYIQSGDTVGHASFAPFNYTFGNGSFQLLWSKDTAQFVLSAGNTDTSEGITVNVPDSGLLNYWVFYRAWYSPVDGKVHLQFNNAAIQDSVDTITALPTTADGTLDVIALTGPGDVDISFDELVIFQRVISLDDGTFIWNGGTGRTWPY